MAPQKSRILTGLVLQGLALLVTYAGSQWLYAIGWLAILVIGIPLFVFSIVVLMRAGGSLGLRLVLSFWPAAIPLAVTGVRQAIVAVQWSRVRTEVFLIPAEYRGDVVVVFDDPEGVPLERERGAAVFRIPAGGELHTRDHAPRFRVDAVNRAIDSRREFYLVDQAGNRTRIEREKVAWSISYANFEPVNGVLEDSRYKFYEFAVGGQD